MTTVSAVPVPGGELVVGRWGALDDSPPVLAIHGITANHLAWGMVAPLVPGPVVAPDLRGRGGSGSLPGPYGMAAHAADCVAVLDALGIERAVVVGHSMGGFVASVLAHRYPARVARLVLVDGGAPLALPGGVDIETALGPAVARLSMRFASHAAYHDFWREHPSFTGWNPAIESYVDYDLAGAEPELRSKVNEDAVRADFVDLHKGAEPLAAYAALRSDTVFLRAERGMFDQPEALYPDPSAIGLAVTTVPGTNHYTILLGEGGARAVAAAVS
ncbi:alpha/beta hydrolase [Actinophytocola glycyrrhizae]|uniref:Alpha/beta hydrolase n=1 Tax=Actinophytocola glycyrrhizae TaxID=2044873 RepID=A0ABV9RVA4_9PSEU